MREEPAGPPWIGPPSERALAHRASVRTIAGWFPAPVAARASRNCGSDNSGFAATLANVCSMPGSLSPPISLSALICACQSAFCCSQTACCFWVAVAICLAAKSIRRCAAGPVKPCSFAISVKSLNSASSRVTPSGNFIASGSNGSGEAGASASASPSSEDGGVASLGEAGGVVSVVSGVAASAGAVASALSLTAVFLQHFDKLLGRGLGDLRLQP